MTDPNKAPERIWVRFPSESIGHAVVWQTDEGTEYVRADLVEKMIDDAVTRYALEQGEFDD